MLLGDTCSYVVHPPVDSYYGDTMTVVLSESSQIIVALHSALSYGPAAQDRILLEKGVPVTISLPAKLFISAFAQSKYFEGEFAVDVWYTHGGDKRNKIPVSRYSNFIEDGATPDDLEVEDEEEEETKGNGEIFDFEPVFKEFKKTSVVPVFRTLGITTLFFFFCCSLFGLCMYKAKKPSKYDKAMSKQYLD